MDRDFVTVAIQLKVAVDAFIVERINCVVRSHGHGSEENVCLAERLCDGRFDNIWISPNCLQRAEDKVGFVKSPEHRSTQREDQQ